MAADARPRIAVFCMPESGHFQLLRGVIECLAATGADVRVYTAARFAQDVSATGAHFVDLFSGRPITEVDDSSMPIPCRYVSFAGVHAAALIDEVRPFRPTLIVCETFSVIGVAVGKALGAPWVNVSPGHDLDPVRIAGRLREDPRVHVSAACEQAVARLRDRHGFPHASPFSFITELSPFLNLCCEPPSFLPPGRRGVFAPLDFFGSHPASVAAETHTAASSGHRRTRVYASFGTVVWRYFRAEAIDALAAASECLASAPEQYEGIISLGGTELDPLELGRLVRPNVEVRSFVHQRAVLSRADVFLTHHGINSTHESILAGVPMLSYPFFWDQPELAARCQALGLAQPLATTPRAPITAGAVRAALDALQGDRAATRERLALARAEELATIAGRARVVQRMLDLASPGAAADAGGDRPQETRPPAAS